MRSTGFIMLFLLSGLILSPVSKLLSQCAGGTITLNGFDSEGGQGTYDDPATGHIEIYYCFKLDKFFEANTNWVHGIFIAWENLPKGAKICEGVTGTQPAQHGSRTWIFLDSAKARKYSLPGPGFYVDEGDGNPKNNYGDNGIGTPQAKFPDLKPFCFSIKIDCGVASPTAYVPKVTVTGDGTTGAWENSACPGDVFRALDGGPNGNGAIVVCGSVLPVKLLSFTAEFSNQGNLVKWLASSDGLFSHFELEVSHDDGSDFQLLYRINGVKGSTGSGNEIANYSFLDLKPSSISFYRLKMIEKDGSYEYSRIISVQQKIKAATQFSLYPNPAAEVILVKNETNTKYGDVFVNVYNIHGKKIKSVAFNLNKPENFIYVDISSYAKGFYVLEIAAGERVIEKLNFIKD